MAHKPFGERSNIGHFGAKSVAAGKPSWDTLASGAAPDAPHPGSVYEWMWEMYEWGKTARADILRLEAACNLPKGDPGSPPLPPPPVGNFMD